MAPRLRAGQGPRGGVGQVPEEQGAVDVDVERRISVARDLGLERRRRRRDIFLVYKSRLLAPATTNCNLA